MRIAYLVSGAGGMYCGSCLRDNRLAARLRDQGRDVLLIPLYTPIRTDEEDVSEDRVYYGGINVYLQQKSAIFRHTPWLVDRVLDNRSLLRGAGRLASRTRAEDLGALTVSVLEGEHGEQAKELDKLIAGLAVIKPDMIHLPNLMFLGTARALRDRLGVPVLCSLAGEDIFLDALLDPYRARANELIRARAADVQGFLAPTRYYAAHCIRHFGLDAARVHHNPMGIRVDDFVPPGSPPPAPFTIGYLARICPEKGIALLAEAFALLRQAGRNCRLRIAGYLGKADEPFFNGVRSFVSAHGLTDHVDVVGEVDRAGKVNFLRSLHVLSVPAVYQEAKGFYLLEALAAGVPVVQPRHGAFEELVEETGGGLLVQPNSPRALADGLAQLMDDAALRADLARRGHDAVRANHTDTNMAEAAWQVFEQYAGPGRPRGPDVSPIGGSS